MFNEFDLKVTAQINNHQVNFLDVTFNLNEENYHPYRKPNNDPLYIDSRSNHPPNIIKQLPKSINDRLSALSSDEKSFKASYENALSRSNHNIKLEYSDKQKRSTQNSNPKRKRNIWFNPPYSKNVRTITEISKVLTARLGIQNAQSHLINRFQNSLKSRGQKSSSFWSRDFVVFRCTTHDV